MLSTGRGSRNEPQRDDKGQERKNIVVGIVCSEMKIYIIFIFIMELEKTY